MEIIIVSPSLNEFENVSGISSVTKFIVDNNSNHKYIHFQLGKKDNERGVVSGIVRILKSLFFWYKTLKAHNQAVIHYNFPLSKKSILRDSLFMWIARLTNRKMVIHLHGGNFLTATHIPSFLNWILQRIFNLPYPIIVLSDLEKDIINKRYHCHKIYVLPNCVDLRDAQQFERQKVGQEHPLVMGYLGRIAETKGMNELLEACVRLKRDKIPFKLHIAGQEEKSGQFLPKFKQELGEDFVYCGIVSGGVKQNFLKALDVFVLPSYFEGLPMALLECMSYGIVPMATNVGSIGQVLSDGENGKFIAIQDADSIYTTFMELNKNRNELFQLSKEARRKIFDSFAPSVYVDKLNSIYREVICN